MVKVLLHQKTKGGRNDKSKEDFGSGVQEVEKNKLVFFEGCSYDFHLEDLLTASAEVLGKGSYSITHKAILEEGTTVVVKRLKEIVSGRREFEQQMEIVETCLDNFNLSSIRSNTDVVYAESRNAVVYCSNFYALTRILKDTPFSQSFVISLQEAGKVDVLCQTGILGSAGYRAPEVIETRKFTQKSDVYSFGVLLLEKLTGKAPAQSSGHE
ncbi:hypothetical protein CRYUN_Cryun29cG0002400 [Craigia yunnanensis]